jgi:hypothetical protein
MGGRLRRGIFGRGRGTQPMPYVFGMARVVCGHGMRVGGVGRPSSRLVEVDVGVRRVFAWRLAV